ncbi:MAG: hypothetical protein IK088_00790, partial [Lachnospiraceae bacterium]|nr:hypothetical protein [Lachnospiraceae bacterium]
ILETGGSHPSFLGLSAAGSAEDGKGQAALTEKLMKIARECDPGCLLSAGIDLDSKESSILFVTDGKDGNGAYSKPMVLFHTAVHEMLPDFGELDLFSGILKAEQLRFAEMYVEAVGEKARWKRYVEASGDAMAEEYLTSIRHCLIKKDPAGFTFHDLQDHLGNNGRPGGMLFSHPIPKPYDFADPKRMLHYLGDRVVLADVDRFVYDTTETMRAEVILRDFSGEVIPEPLSVRLYETSTGTDLREALHFAPIVRKESETFYCLGEAAIDFKKVPVMHGRMVSVRLAFIYKKQEWTYDFYAVPTFLPVCPDTVLETRTMTERAWKHLSEGGTVFLTPEVRPMERTRPMFVRKDSPLLKPLGLNDYSDVRFGTISRSPGVPLSDRVTPFLTILRHPFDGPLLTPLFEAGMGGGQVIVSLLNLKDNLEDRTVRMMLARIYDYMDSYDFSPNREIRADELQALLSEIQ